MVLSFSAVRYRCGDAAKVGPCRALIYVTATDNWVVSGAAVRWAARYARYGTMAPSRWVCLSTRRLPQFLSLLRVKVWSADLADCSFFIEKFIIFWIPNVSARHIRLVLWMIALQSGRRKSCICGQFGSNLLSDICPSLISNPVAPFAYRKACWTLRFITIDWYSLVVQTILGE